MANPPRTGRPVADHVDPPTPRPADTNTFTSDTNTATTTADETAPVLEISDEEIEVKTSGAFLLMDPQTAKHFDNETAVPTKQTQFVAENLASGKLVKA